MALKHFGLQEGYYENYTSLILLLSSSLQLLRSISLWFIPMLIKPCLASLAQTCMKCKMRKTRTQTCRNNCGEACFYSALPYLSCVKPSSLGVWENGKKGGTVKDASSAVSPSFALSIGVSLSLPVPGVSMSYPDRHFSWWHTCTFISSTIENLTNLCPPPPSHCVFTPQAMRVDCDTHTTSKCTHAYTWSKVMNDPLRAELTSWDHFLLLFFFLWPFTLIH